MSSVAPDLKWRLDKLGQWSDPAEFDVTTERVIAYAKATNDEHPAHLAGELAPPVFAIVPVFDALAPAITAVIPGELIMRVLHGEQDFVYHQPIRPGEALITRAAPLAVRGASSGVTVIGKAETTTEDGAPVVDQYMTLFVRGAQINPALNRSSDDSPAGHAFDPALGDGEPFARVTHGYDPDQTYRYSEASGDLMPIHLDNDLAKKMSLPGIIVHGLCTMAFCSRAVIQTACPEDPTRMKRLAVRFSSIVQPSETVTHALHDAGSTDNRRRVAFETTTDTGNPAIKDGLAEIAP